MTEGSETGLQFVNITTNGVLNGNTSQVYVIKHPLSFVYNQNEPWDWYTDNETYQNDALWGEGVDKSESDPCPKGWRAPTDASKTYGDFSTVTMTASGLGTNVANGRKYSNMAWFPAAGYRYSGSGVLGYVGDQGYYWSASVSGTDAKRLRFTMGDVNPSSLYYRVCGFSVRCVQE